MPVAITLDDLTPLIPDLDPGVGAVMIEDAIATALMHAPCLAAPDLDPIKAAAAKAIIRGALVRWYSSMQATDYGALASETDNQTAGIFGQNQARTFDTTVPRTGMFYKSEIQQLKSLCAAPGGFVAFDTAPTGPVIGMGFDVGQAYLQPGLVKYQPPITQTDDLGLDGDLALADDFATADLADDGGVCLPCQLGPVPVPVIAPVVLPGQDSALMNPAAANEVAAAVAKLNPSKRRGLEARYTVFREPYQTGGTDVLGNQVVGYGPPEEVKVFGWFVPVMESSAGDEPARDHQTRRLTLMLPTGSQGHHRDRWTIGGVQWVEDGEIQDYSDGNPFGYQQVAQAVINLTRTEG